MHLSTRRARALTVIALLVLALSAAAWAGVRSAQRSEARGREAGFPQPTFGASSLQLGVNAALEQYDDAALAQHLARLSAAGITSIRQEFRWSTIEPARGEFDWRASDRIFAAARRHKLHILAVLWTTPEWARDSSGSANAPAIDTAPPRDPMDYARFAGAFARRYDAAPDSPLLAYQIWDEPNLSAAWGNGLLNPTLYLQVLRAARAAIRAVNPYATIALAALAPTVEQSNVNVAPQTYLLKLYQLGGHQDFDVAAAKPYGFGFRPDDRRVDPGVLNLSHLILMREVMTAHGDGHKAIWAAQFGWNALSADWQGESSIWGSVSEAQQAEYTRAAVQRAAREWPWLGAMFIDGLQPRMRADEHDQDARWGFALLDQNGNPRPLFDAYAAAVQDAAAAPRANLFAACRLPQSVAHTLRLENLATALPEITSSQPDCRDPNPNAAFSPGWRFDQLGADIPELPDARVTVRFHGDALALIVRRGNYRAYTYVMIDGQPANRLPRDERGAYLVMTAPALAPLIETIPVASGLGPGEHVAEITVERGWNQWALIGWSAPAAGLDGRIALGNRLLPLLMALAAVLFVFGLRRADGSAWWRDAWARLRAGQPAPTWRTVIAALVLWLTSSIAWATDAATAWQNLGLPANAAVSGVLGACVGRQPVRARGAVHPCAAAP
jgi:Beta-galactosidase